MDISKLLTKSSYRTTLERYQEDAYKCRERLVKWFPNGPFAFVHDDHILEVADAILGIVDDEDIPVIEAYLTKRTHNTNELNARKRTISTAQTRIRVSTEIIDAAWTKKILTTIVC